MTKKAIAYASDVILDRTGDLISRAAQKELICEYAKTNDIEIAEWIEDEVYEESLLKRPGVKRLLERAADCDCILVERVWSLSRNWKRLKPVMEQLESKGTGLEAASCLWDCVSVVSRHYNSKSASGQNAAASLEAELLNIAKQTSPKSGSRPKVAKPDRLHFVQMQKR